MKTLINAFVTTADQDYALSLSQLFYNGLLHHPALRAKRPVTTGRDSESATANTASNVYSAVLPASPCRDHRHMADHRPYCVYPWCNHAGFQTTSSAMPACRPRPVTPILVACSNQSGNNVITSMRINNHHVKNPHPSQPESGAQKDQRCAHNPGCTKGTMRCRSPSIPPVHHLHRYRLQ